MHLPGTGSLPTAGIVLVLVGGTAVLVLLRGRFSAAAAPTWACGQAVEPALGWTSAGFTKPIRLVLESILRPEREITTRSEGGVLQEVAYAGRVPHLIDDRLYRPAARLSLVTAGHARKLQSGSLGTYIGYLIALVIALLLVVRLGVIG